MLVVLVIIAVGCVGGGIAGGLVGGKLGRDGWEFGPAMGVISLVGLGTGAGVFTTLSIILWR